MNISINVQSLKPSFYNIPSVSTVLDIKDYIGAIKVRWGIGRNNYTIVPGIYKTGNPNNKSDVFVSANYKLSFDTLRKNLTGIDAWILVIDTKGVNVWCAAGKNTFGTNNIIKSIKDTSLELIVKHRKIILPQLAAPGVAAHIVNDQTGFKLIYGPIHAKDINPFIQAGYKATPEMRKITFPFKERAKLIPVDFISGLYKLLFTLCIFFLLSGLDKSGILFSKMLVTSPFPIINLICAYIAGIAIAPLMLPYIPFRTFSLKGAVWGIVSTIILYPFFHASTLEMISISILNISIASFLTMNFTGSSTYTSLSGVKMEMKWSIPFQIAFAIIGLSTYIITKFN